MLERRSEDELRTRLRQQASVAELGRRALSGAPLAALLDAAVEQISQELGSPVVSVSEHGPDGRLRPRASAGPIEPGADPQARSSAEVGIGTAERPWGILAASSRRADDFGENDLNFMQGIANVLAAAVERERAQGEIEREQQRLRDALAHASESETRFRELADHAPVFIWTTGPDGLVDFINEGWLAFTGRSLDDELGDTWTLGVHPDEAEQVRATWWRALQRRVPWEQEYRLRRADGEYRWIVDRGVPRFAEGEFRGYVGTATDIHERKRAEQQLSQAYERDHQVAETLQRSLLPETLPAIDGVGLQARYIPAARGTAIGGDWYDAVELEDGRVALVVGDVVGHGLRAAAVMGQLRNAFRAYALLNASPAETLARLNRLLSVDGRDVMATALYLILDRDTGRVAYSNAGHPPALVMEPGGARFLEGGRSVPLGTADPATYRDEEDRIELGSTVLLYTDGLVERRDTPLGDRLAQLATVAGVADGELGDVCDEILSGVLGGMRPPDDVALLAIRPEPLDPGSLRLRLPAEPASLVRLRRRLGRFLQAADASEEERFEVTLTVCEAAANAIEHAYGPADAEFEVDVRLVADQLTATVSDTGTWRERPSAEGVRGRGIGIIRGLMDEVDVDRSPRGTTVVMRRRLGIGAAA